MKKRFLLMIAAILTITAISGCGGEKVPETANTDGTKMEASETEESEVAEESQETASADSGMAALISRFQGDWNGAMIFTDCVGAYEYLQDGWTSCLARFVIDEEGNTNTYGEPVVIKVNKSFGQKVAGQVIKYVSKHVEIESTTSHTK